MTTATKYKPYPQYKPSGIDWLGDIPDGWVTKKLKYGFYFTKGKNAALYTDEYNAENAGDYPVYSGQTEGEGVMGLIDSYDYDFEKVIFTTTVGAKVMTPLLLSGKFSLSQNCLLMIKSSKQVFEKYFYYQLFPLFDREKSLVPSHMQPSLRFSDLNTFDVAYPEIAEQKSIVDFLDRETAKIDEVVEKKQKMMELVKEKRQALITHAVTKGLDPKAKMKPSGIDWLGDVPEEWEVKRLKYLCSRSADYGLNIEAENYQFQGVRFIRTSDVNDDGYLSEDGVYLNSDLVPFDYLLSEGDILLSRSGTIGRSYICSNLDKKSTYAGYLVRFRSQQNKLRTRFIYYFLHSQTFFDWIKTQLIETTIGNVNGQKYANIPIQLPSNEEQQSIAEYLDHETAKIDGVMKKVETQIEKLQEFRQALISNVVTGKIKV